ncbi:MAG: hypothetical protein HQ498_04330 [Pseudohongiella sp.]|nr:hypothetical protein [Pseudohongiella sp.]
MSQAKLNIVVAHGLEAKPLIAMLSLNKQAASRAYPLYQNDRGVSLIVSGMGKVAAAAATAYLAARQENEANSVQAWLNLGIAGHQTEELGKALLACKISDRSTGLSFYPPMWLSGFSTSAVITVDQPALEYPENAAYEMEAMGFYATATRFVTSELVQVFKIISDNRSNHVHNIDLNSVGMLISDQREQIMEIIRQLGQAAQDFNRLYQLPDEFLALNSKCNFTASQQVQLKRMCQRYIALGLQSDLRRIIEDSNTAAKQIMHDLQSGLADHV